jgi:hypothetical protein
MDARHPYFVHYISIRNRVMNKTKINKLLAKCSDVVCGLLYQCRCVFSGLTSEQGTCYDRYSNRYFVKVTNLSM